MTSQHKRKTIKVYLLGKRIHFANYFNYEIIKITTSERVKNSWINKGNFFSMKKLRVSI